jgi:membrane protease YdiL (CAAX protease family)
MTDDVPDMAGPFSPLWLTMLALGVCFLLLIFTIPLFDPVTAVGLSQCLAFGGIGMLGASLHPSLEAKELGLTPLAARFLLPILLLLPLVFLVSELDNWIRDWMATAPPLAKEISSEEIGDSAMGLVALGIYRIGLTPLVTEWFFRGMIQERLRRHFGVRQAIVGSASLFAVATAMPGENPSDYISGITGLFIMGLVFGTIRWSSGSILPGILLSGGLHAVAIISYGLKDSFPIPGFTVENMHSSGWLIVPSLVSAVCGLALVRAFKAPVPIDEDS